MSASPKGVLLAAWLLPLAAGTPAARAQDDEPFDRTPRDCLIVSSINTTEAVDDQNIIFRMRGDRVFRNHLPRKCPGLARENRFMYETRGGRLCSIDTITVLEQYGVNLQRGFTCRLGEFVPLSPEEVEDLEFLADPSVSQPAIKAEPVERRRGRGDSNAAESAEPPAAVTAPAAETTP